MGGSDLFTGTLDLLILRAVQPRPLHGYAIGRWIRERSESVLDVEEGVLYPALHRLEGKRLIESAWAKSETGRRAKFYRLAPAGVAALQEESRRWNTFSRAVSAVLSPEGS